MRAILVIAVFLLGATTSKAAPLSISNLIDPFGLFQITSMEGLLDERGTAGARYVPDGTRGGGKFLKAIYRTKGGGKTFKRD